MLIVLNYHRHAYSSLPKWPSCDNILIFWASIHVWWFVCSRHLFMWRTERKMLGRSCWETLLPRMSIQCSISNVVLTVDCGNNSNKCVQAQAKVSLKNVGFKWAALMLLRSYRDPLITKMSSLANWNGPMVECRANKSVNPGSILSGLFFILIVIHQCLYQHSYLVKKPNSI